MNRCEFGCEFVLGLSVLSGSIDPPPGAAAAGNCFGCVDLGVEGLLCLRVLYRLLGTRTLYLEVVDWVAFAKGWSIVESTGRGLRCRRKDQIDFKPLILAFLNSCSDNLNFHCCGLPKLFASQRLNSLLHFTGFGGNNSFVGYDFVYIVFLSFNIGRTSGRDFVLILCKGLFGD